MDDGRNLHDCSVITPYGYETGSCGYCKNVDTSASYYAHAVSLKAEHYQILMDRSWRRSGKLLYYPDNLRSCCPHYTIRLSAKDYTPRRDQRQALNRWNKFVLGNDYIDTAKQSGSHHSKDDVRRKKQHRRHSFDLVETIHQSETTSLNSDGGTQPSHSFSVTLEVSNFSDEKYNLFETYQQAVHKEAKADISKAGFTRFLCDSPLQEESRVLESGDVQKLGTYHQTYRLDGVLIAFAVLDLLPSAVSAVYFVYDPAYEEFSLGKISAMREAALALESHYVNYYMGFYIHSCSKMRYKADFRPQQVLDLIDHSWQALDNEACAAMDNRSFGIPSNLRIRTSPSTGTTNEPAESPAEAAASGKSILSLSIPGLEPLENILEHVNVGQCLLRIGPRIVSFDMLVAWDDGDYLDPASLKGLVAELVACTGLSVARHMIIQFGSA